MLFYYQKNILLSVTIKKFRVFVDFGKKKSQFLPIFVALNNVKMLWILALICETIRQNQDKLMTDGRKEFMN